MAEAATPIRPRSPEQEQALATVRQNAVAEAAPALIEQGRAEARAEWRPHTELAVSQAVAAAKNSLREQHDKNMRLAHSGGFWRGFGIGSFVMAGVLIFAVWFIYRDWVMTNVAAATYTERGSIEVPPLTIRDGDAPAVRTDGWVRPGREPASAP